jgi:hypothetical protein
MRKIICMFGRLSSYRIRILKFKQAHFAHYDTLSVYKIVILSLEMKVALPPVDHGGPRLESNSAKVPNNACFLFFISYSPAYRPIYLTV